MEYEIRNPVRISETMIDVEWNVPGLGWMPFSASSDDVEAHGRAIYALAEAMLDEEE